MPRHLLLIANSNLVRIEPKGDTMKNCARISLLVLALVLTGIGTLSADGTPSCGISCSAFDREGCTHVYDPEFDCCIPIKTRPVVCLGYCCVAQV
jgi:hypothetical protein